MGSGGVGGYYGGVLARGGHELWFVARGAHLDALRDHGLEIRSSESPIRLRPVRAVAAPAEAGSGFDLVLFTVKGYDTEAAATALRPVVGSMTAILTLQNGVDSAERLGAILDGTSVLAGTTTIESTIAAPGVIEQKGPRPRIVLGEPSGTVTPRAETIAGVLRDAGIETVVSADMRRTLWEKFVRLAPSASLTSACGASIGTVRATPEGGALYRTLVAEAVAVGRAAGAALAHDAVETSMTFIMALPPAMTTSMQRDYDRRGRVELEELTGTVVRLGRALAVPTPAFETIYGILKVRALAFGGLA